MVTPAGGVHSEDDETMMQGDVIDCACVCVCDV